MLVVSYEKNGCQNDNWTHDRMTRHSRRSLFTPSKGRVPQVVDGSLHAARLANELAAPLNFLALSLVAGVYLVCCELG
jgi:hypothetical protein